MVILYGGISGRGEDDFLFVFYLGEYYCSMDGVILNGNFFCGGRGYYMGFYFKFFLVLFFVFEFVNVFLILLLYDCFLVFFLRRFMGYF